MNLQFARCRHVVLSHKQVVTAHVIETATATMVEHYNEYVGRRTAAPNLAEGDYSAPQNLLAGFEEVASRRRRRREQEKRCERNGERERKERGRKSRKRDIGGAAGYAGYAEAYPHVK